MRKKQKVEVSKEWKRKKASNNKERMMKEED